MEENKQYIICKAMFSKDLEDRINELIKLGYRPSGSMFYDSGYGNYIQPMIFNNIK